MIWCQFCHHTYRQGGLLVVYMFRLESGSKHDVFMHGSKGQTAPIVIVHHLPPLVEGGSI